MGQPWHWWITQSVTDPRGVARLLMAMNLSREHVWMALAATCALGAILTSLPILGVTTPPPEWTPIQVQMFEMMRRPVIFALINFAGTVVFIFGFHWTGRALGGTGRLEDMAVLITWLQVVMLVFQAVLFVLGLILAPIAALLSIAVLPVTLWMTVNFVDCAHGFDSLMKALGVMFAWVVGLTLGLTMLLALMGVGAGGMPANV
ncbi:Yip1 family protein [Pseudaestuariivita atlantica]|nr:Yip1 family protein [Pseudaestuariivita atlantica]